MKRGPQGRYSKEFREEAVKLVTEEGLSVPEAGRRLSLSPLPDKTNSEKARHMLQAETEIQSYYQLEAYSSGR